MRNGEQQARVVVTVLKCMARLGRFTVPQLIRETELPRDSVRSIVLVAEELGWIRIDGFGERPLGAKWGSVPIAYRWIGVTAA